MANYKNIIILSEKSSGSSACQYLLAKYAKVQHISKTRHYEHETLYWTKAASVLNLPQIKMVDSEVPIKREKAKLDLIALLKDNLEDYVPATVDKEMIIEEWKLLCKKYSPIFIEKSPHHLCQWSAIELIIDFIREVSDVEVMIIGLVRNPMDTIYSQYKRWHSQPEKVEKQWIIAYQNLLKLQNILGKKLLIVRYEDMVSSLKSMQPVFSFCEMTISDADSTYLHKKSLQKWKSDVLFGFSLSNEAVEIAKRYGYKEEEIKNETRPLWPVAKVLSSTVLKPARHMKNMARKILISLRLIPRLRRN